MVCYRAICMIATSDRAIFKKGFLSYNLQDISMLLCNLQDDSFLSRNLLGRTFLSNNLQDRNFLVERLVHREVAEARSNFRRFHFMLV